MVNKDEYIKWILKSHYGDFSFFKMAAAAMLDFWNYKVLTVGLIISAELRHHAKFRGDWSNCCHDISILDFSKWWQPQSWIFKILFLTIRTVKKDELRHCAKFCRNRSNPGGDMSVFDLSRWRPPPSWIFEISNFKFLTVGTVKRFELHHRAKFRQNRLNHGRGMAIFYFWRWRPPPSWIFEISNF